MKVATVFALLLVSATAFNAPQFATRAVGKAPATKAVAKKAVKVKAVKVKAVKVKAVKPVKAVKVKAVKVKAPKKAFKLKGATAVRYLLISSFVVDIISYHISRLYY